MRGSLTSWPELCLELCPTLTTPIPRSLCTYPSFLSLHGFFSRKPRKTPSEDDVSLRRTIWLHASPFMALNANWSLHCAFSLGNLLQTHGFDLYAHDLYFHIPSPNLSQEFSSHLLNPASLPGCPIARILVAGKFHLNCCKQSRN